MSQIALRTQIEQAARVLLDGGIVAYPTEAVFGLGCDPLDEAAARRLIGLKQRDPAQGLIVIGADEEQLEGWIDPDARWMEQARPTWPGPVTWIFPRGPLAPDWICGAHQSVAVRLTSHPVAHALAQRAGRLIVSTSANRHGEPPLRTAQGVQQSLGAALDYVIDAPVGDGERPTEIRDARSGAVVRHG